MMSMPYSVAIDGNEANTTNRVGSNVFAHSLLTALAEIQQSEIRFTVLTSKAPIKELPEETTGWQYRQFGPERFWTQWALPLHLYTNRNEYDAFFTPSHYAPRYISIPYISSVMDTAYLDFPTEFSSKDRVQLTAWTGYSVRNARKVLAISEATKRSIEQHYNRKKSDVFVAYPGHSSLESISTSQVMKWLKKLGIDSHFFLHIGTLQPRKRITHIIKAFELVCDAQDASSKKSYRGSSNHPDAPHLILAGKIGWLADDIITGIQRSRWAHHIHAVGFIDDTLKIGLLKQAIGLIAIGDGEGFGIPVLEAMQSKCIPIVSKAGSLPEVVGNAGIIISPAHSNALSDAMSELLYSSRAERQRLAKLGLHQSKRFDWHSTALIVFEHLLEMCKQATKGHST